MAGNNRTSTHHHHHRSIIQSILFLFLSCYLFIERTNCNFISDDNTILQDTQENDKVTLQCRFSIGELSRETPTFYWSRSVRQRHDNAAIGDDPLDPNYKLEYRPELGIYDLIINGTSYERDNGRFECHVKARGSGHDIYAKTYILTVLTSPQPPQIAPASFVVVTEGRRQDLTCSSTGGSPDPTIEWFREGSNNVPLEASVKFGSMKDRPTTSTLTIVPKKEDDGAVFRCMVRNRAMPKNDYLQATVTLQVNYYPRIEVGPENPLRVERDASVTLECNVDAKPQPNSVQWKRNGRIVSSTASYVLHRVSVQDAGKYICNADNNLGKTGEQELTLDVLHGPVISLSAKTQEAYEGESVTIKCNITANPNPISVEWIKDDGRHEFRQIGEYLRLDKVKAADSGTYTCRARNILNPSVLDHTKNATAPPTIVERTGNGSIALLIRHKPGKARILPDKPIVNEGASVTLTCMATPSGWPSPQFRWFKVSGSSSGAAATTSLQQQQQQNVIETGTKYYISNVQLSHEGAYYCQATNELGQGESAFVHLQVNQPPRFLAKLNTFYTKKVSTYDYAIFCKVQAKPKPEIEWLKDGEELLADINMYEVKMNATEDRFGVVTVLSVLKFSGRARPKGSQLLPSDRGVYTCVAHNEVRKIESTMQLRIEHEPLTLNQYNKVAYDNYKTAEIPCKIQAYPRPDFHWYFESSLTPLQSSSDGHYFINSSTTMDNDIYTSVLNVRNIDQNDYGEYICQVNNDVGSVVTNIRLQAKGPPDQPTTLIQRHIGHNNVTLSWMPGFNGGISTTKYFVLYRKVSLSANEIVDMTMDEDGDTVAAAAAAAAAAGSGQKQRIIDDCGHHRFYSSPAAAVAAAAAVSSSALASSEQYEFDCEQQTVCTILNLDQDQTYEFKVKAINSKGSSDYSPTITLTTDVDRIPNAERVVFNPASKMLAMSIPATCLKLDAIVEFQVFSNNIAYWQIADSFPLNQASGHEHIYRERVLDSYLNNHLFASAKIGAVASASASSSSSSSLSSSSSSAASGDDLFASEPQSDQQQQSQTGNDENNDLFTSRIRVQLCLNANRQQCGDYADAEVGAIPIHESTSIAASTMVAVVVSCIVFLLFIVVFCSFCNCHRNNCKQKEITNMINASKDYEMDSVRAAAAAAAAAAASQQQQQQHQLYQHHSHHHQQQSQHQQQQQQLHNQQTQSPPPYYQSSNGTKSPIILNAALDNKALEHCLDLALSTSSSSSMLLDEQKANRIYGATTTGHGMSAVAALNANPYGTASSVAAAAAANTALPTPSQQNLNNEWMNVTYLDSNNLQSQQDILWQMRNAQNQQEQQYLINLLDRQGSTLASPTASSTATTATVLAGSQTGVGNYDHYGTRLQQNNAVALNYDPIQHGGYSMLDDYSTYPQLTGANVATISATGSASAAASHSDMISLMDNCNLSRYGVDSNSAGQSNYLYNQLAASNSNISSSNFDYHRNAAAATASGDSYGSVIKTKKKFDGQKSQQMLHHSQYQTTDSSNYHDINGLPNFNGAQHTTLHSSEDADNISHHHHHQQQQQHLSHQQMAGNNDPANETTYSTPNSRTRRVIREIIV